MALKMSSGADHTAPKPSKSTSNMDTSSRAAPVYGPELPPSMVRDKAPVQLANIPIPMTFHGEYSEDMLRSENMKQIESEMQQLFHSRLLSIMSEYGYTDADFSEADVADVMVARGLMKSPTDDPILALASEVKHEMWQIVHGHLNHATDAAVEPAQLAGMAAADPIVFNTLVDMDRHYTEMRPAECDGVNYDDIVRLMRGYSLSDLSSSPTANAGKPPAEPASSMTTEPQPKSEHTSANAAAVNGAAKEEPGTDGKSQKKKKKRNKRKSRGKGKLEDDAENTKPLNPAVDHYATAATELQSTNGPEQTPDIKSKLHVQIKEFLCQSKQPQDTRSKTTGIPRAKSMRPAPPPPPPSSSSLPSTTINSQSSMLKRSDFTPEPLWEGETPADFRQVREFWLSLSEVEQEALVMVEKEVVLARVRDQQNFSCNCSSCTRKREAIESELDCLYDCYYDVLKENIRKVKLRTWVVSAKQKAQAIILESVEMMTDSIYKLFVEQSKPSTREEVQRNILDCLRESPEANIIFGSEFHKLIELEKTLQSPMMSELGNIDAKGVETIRDAAELSLHKQISTSVEKYGKGKEPAEQPQEAEKEKDENPPVSDYAMSETAKESQEHIAKLRRVLGDELLYSDESTLEISNNNDLFYTDQMLESIDAFPTDSKKFFEMMVRLADYRIRREDAMLSATNGLAALDMSDELHEEDVDPHDITRGEALQHMHRRCPDCHGEISESEDRQYYSEDLDEAANGYGGRKRARAESQGSYYDDEDEEYEDEEYSDEDLLLDNGDDLDTDDEFDELDSESAEREIENGRKVFRLFVARLFEQRVINAYREKIARDVQYDLIQELEEEEKRSQAKDKRKQKKKQREKEKKRLIQQQKEEERLAREAQQRAEEERKRAEAERSRQEKERKRREEAEKARKAQEERNRRILEQADRRLEKERQEKLRLEQERLEKERREREEREKAEREQKEREQRERAQAQKQAKQKAKAQAKSKQRPDSLPAAASVPAVSKQQQQQQQQQPADLLLVSSTQPTTVQSAVSYSEKSAERMASAECTPISLASIATAPPVPSGISLLDSLQHHTPTLPPASAFKTSRPSLPVISPPRADIVAPTTPLLLNTRSRANSGPSLAQPQLSAPATSSLLPGMASMVSDVPPELDAEVSSIVGRVMDSSTLQGDLIGGVEWRASPADRFAGMSTAANQPLGNRGGFGLSSSLSLLSEQNVRRNSMPMNRLARDNGVSAVSEDMEAVQTAYYALEKFRRDKVGVDPSIAHSQYGGYQSAADIAAVHGRMSESEVWARCLAYAQSNASRCCLDHSTRSVAFACSVPSAPSPVKPLAGDRSQAGAATQQLPAISEDIFSAFSLQTSQPTSSLLPSARLPLNGMTARQQPHSPMMQPQRAPGSAATQPFAPQSLQAGARHSPGSQAPSSLFMGHASMNASPSTLHNHTMHPPPFAVSSFQQSLHNAPSLGPRNPSDSPIASMMQPPLSMPNESHPSYSLPYGSSFMAPSLWTPPKQDMIQPPLHGSIAQVHADKFQERETASENMYIRKKEEEELKALREKLAQVEKQVDDLKKHVDEKEAQAKSK
ncbi:Stress response protein nst1 [Coemansia sp. RSA 2336]|nr:Stress response protein nst1 [Coemansia sp. RSA 2336]